MPGAAFALDQDGAVGIGDLVNQVVNQLHFPAGTDDVFEPVSVLQLLPEINVLAQRRLVIERPLHRHLQFVDLERLGHIIVRAHLHRLDRGLDRGVGGDQDDGGLPMMFAHVPENIEARHRLHFDVGDDDMGLNGVDLFDGFRCGIEGENLVPFFPAKRHDDFHHRGLVIDNYDFSHSQRGEYFRIEKRKEEMRKS